ncbi:hypothetical protein OG863_38795 [Streptomyces decoyicus]|uniref:Transposase n=1 Tax=Streptomyces decoyicus TaxID=249567 RepID=A0ABZ1FSF7_9ACTN|nr:hypothetical protein [Streptomyces decoyicus]WSB73423.1 hypothetical protein OG863_38795 [Streptomyces decoyicus]
MSAADDSWERLLQHIQPAVDAKGGIDRDIHADSTSVRAHQYAAGAPKAPAAPPKASKGAAQRPVHVPA